MAVLRESPPSQSDSLISPAQHLITAHGFSSLSCNVGGVTKPLLKTSSNAGRGAGNGGAKDSVTQPPKTSSCHVSSVLCKSGTIQHTQMILYIHLGHTPFSRCRKQ
eukprot:6470176-Amphidinium_carterae.3